jgi:preflagellin peptidase FlaK
VLASVPDLLRLLAVPFFGYVAWRDVKTRRVSNRTWYPLAGLAVVLLAWETVATFTGTLTSFEQRLFAIRVAVSLGLVAPLAYLFWRLGGFGGADAKAFIILAVLFPTYPHYALWEIGLPVGTLPLVETTLGVFSLTVLSNTVVVGLAYPLLLAGRNALQGQFSPVMFVGRPIPATAAVEEYGSILTLSDGGLLADLSPAGLRAYFAWRGLDLDALRMYLRWRDTSLDALRAEPDRHRDPASLPAVSSPPGDGAIATDGGRELARTTAATADPWGAEAFLADIEGSAYGTDPETLRAGLETLVSEEVVWISPGIPFLVPLFGGLVVAVTYGDVLFALFGLAGLV